MDSRRFFHAAIFYAAIITAAGGTAAQAPNQPGSPAAAVQAFLQYDVPGHRRAVFDYRKPTPLMRQLLSKSLVADWFSAMRYNDQFPVFDGNPFDGMQGSGGSQVLAVSTQSDDGDTAVVAATLTKRNASSWCGKSRSDWRRTAPARLSFTPVRRPAGTRR